MSLVVSVEVQIPGIQGAAGSSASATTNASQLTSGTLPDARLSAVGTAGTYTKVTTDAKGRVSSGTTLVAGDLPNHSAALLTSGSLADARLSGNIPKLDAANIFSASQEIHGNLTVVNEGAITTVDQLNVGAVAPIQVTTSYLNNLAKKNAANVFTGTPQTVVGDLTVKQVGGGASDYVTVSHDGTFSILSTHTSNPYFALRNSNGESAYLYWAGGEIRGTNPTLPGTISIGTFGIVMSNSNITKLYFTTGNDSTSPVDCRIGRTGTSELTIDNGSSGYGKLRLGQVYADTITANTNTLTLAAPAGDLDAQFAGQVYIQAGTNISLNAPSGNVDVSNLQIAGNILSNGQSFVMTSGDFVIENVDGPISLAPSTYVAMPNVIKVPMELEVVLTGHTTLANGCETFIEFAGDGGGTYNLTLPTGDTEGRILFLHNYGEYDVLIKSDDTFILTMPGHTGATFICTNGTRWRTVGYAQEEV